MKIIYQGDIHLRSSVPVNRVDDYNEAQFNKLGQLVEFANVHGDALLLGGDLFDSPKVSSEVVNDTIDVLSGCNVQTLSCLGQHDVPFHQMVLKKSPVYPLYTSAAITYCEDGKALEIDDGVIVHFCSWEQAVTAPIEGMFNIFLGHVSVFDKVPFYWKGEGYSPKTLKEKYPGYQLYLCGDIHSPLVDDNVVVSGPMMRMSVNHIDYQPRCYLIDTDTMEITPLYYKIEEDVFSIPNEEIESTLNLDNLIGAMKSSAVGKESYKRDCYALAGEDEEVKEILGEIFDELS